MPRGAQAHQTLNRRLGGQLVERDPLRAKGAVINLKAAEKAGQVVQPRGEEQAVPEGLQIQRACSGLVGKCLNPVVRPAKQNEVTIEAVKFGLLPPGKIRPVRHIQRTEARFACLESESNQEPAATVRQHAMQARCSEPACPD